MRILVLAVLFHDWNSVQMHLEDGTRGYESINTFHVYIVC